MSENSLVPIKSLSVGDVFVVTKNGVKCEYQVTQKNHEIRAIRIDRTDSKPEIISNNLDVFTKSGTISGNSTIKT